MKTLLSRAAARVGLVALMSCPTLIVAFPAEAEAAVTVLSSSSYADSVNQRHIVGEVRNDGTSNVRFVQVTVTYHDSSDRLLATETADSTLAVLAPGEKSPFRSITEELPEYDHYKLSVSGSATTEMPNHNFTTTVTNEYDDALEYRHIVGTVRNNNTTTAEFVKPVITLYDANGTVVDSDFTFVDSDGNAALEPRATAPFELAVPLERNWTSYAIVTESTSPPASDGGSSPPATSPPSPAPQQAPTLTLSPATISAGQATVVTYRGTPGSTADILSRTQPSTVFTKVGTVTLDSNGVGTSSHKPQKNTRITARSADGTMSSTAPIIAVRSVASFNARRVGTRIFTFTGRVYPALNNRLVNLYRNGTLVAQGRSDATGIYTITKTLAGGTFTFQVRTPNDQDNLGTSSRELRLLIS